MPLDSNSHGCHAVQMNASENVLERLSLYLPRETAIALEQAMFRLTCDQLAYLDPLLVWDYAPFISKYRQRYRQVFLNLIMPHCQLKRLITEAVNEHAQQDPEVLVESLKDILKGSSKSFAPEVWEKCIADAAEAEQEKEEVLLDSQVECGHCKRKKMYARNVQTDQKQTRSGDEGMTTFCYCRTCHRRWKF